MSGFMTKVTSYLGLLLLLLLLEMAFSWLILTLAYWVERALPLLLLSPIIIPKFQLYSA